MGNHQTSIKRMLSTTFLLTLLVRLRICQGVSVVSGDVGTWPQHGYPANTWRVENLLTWSKPEVFAKNYWLAPDKETGGQFILDLGQTVAVKSIVLVNTHNGRGKDRGTKGFR